MSWSFTLWQSKLSQPSLTQEKERKRFACFCTEPLCLTIDDFYVPAASRPIGYDCKSEWSSVGAKIFIKASDVNSFFIRAQTAVSGGQGGTVVVGVCDLDGDCSRGRLWWHVWGRQHLIRPNSTQTVNNTKMWTEQKCETYVCLFPENYYTQCFYNTDKVFLLVVCVEVCSPLGFFPHSLSDTPCDTNWFNVFCQRSACYVS